MLPETIAWILGLLLVAEVVRSHLRLRGAALRRRPDPPAPSAYPSVTVIRPIRDLDPGFRRNARASLEQDYPGRVETLFVFDDADEPAVPIVREEIERLRRAGRPVDARVLFAGAPPPGRTGKLNAMIAGMHEATGDLVAFADSDTRPGPHMLRHLVATLLSSPKVGAAFAPVVVDGDLRTVGDAAYAVLLNSLYAPQAAIHAWPHGDMPFIMGQFMVLRPDALADAGGLSGSVGQLVDDMHIGTRMAAAGYLNRMSSRPLRIVQRGMGPVEMLRTFRRWIVFSRSGLPQWSFNWWAQLRAIEFWLGLIVGVPLLAAGSTLLSLPWLAASFAVGLSLVALHRVVCGERMDRRHAIAAWLVLLIGPAIYVASFSHRRVRWRSRTYGLDGGARLGDGHWHAPRWPLRRRAAR